MNNIQKEAWKKLVNSVEWNTITIDKGVYQEMQEELKSLREISRAIVNNYEKHIEDRGGEYFEVYTDPFTNREEDNQTFVPVKLMNALRKAVKGSS